jgi:hypothetical protein
MTAILICKWTSYFEHLLIDVVPLKKLVLLFLRRQYVDLPHFAPDLSFVG